MPNRILKESICTSESIDALSFQEEAFFYRLLVNCDDFGRMDGRESVLKARLFPLREISHEDIGAAIARLAELGMVRRYQAEGRPYLQVVKWEAHQSIRAKRSKYPSPLMGEDEKAEDAPALAAPPPPKQDVPAKDTLPPPAQDVPAGASAQPQASESLCMQPQAPENLCKQMHASAGICSRNPIQSEYVSQSESEAESKQKSGLLSAADAARWREDLSAVESQALRMGMAFAPSDAQRAESLMAEYSAPWLLTAMRRAETGQASCRSWRYIGGILASWKEKGGIDLVHGGNHRGGEKQGHGKAEGAVCPPLRIRRY